MKKLWITSALFFAGLLSAQELSNDQITILKYDNAAKFSELISKQDLEKCFTVKENSYTMLALAIKMNSTKVFDKLLEQRPDLEKICDGKTALMFAAKYGNTDFAKKLLESGAKKDTKTDKGYSALDYAKKYEKTEIVKLLE